jgi:hypothetical protein
MLANITRAILCLVLFLAAGCGGATVTPNGGDHELVPASTSDSTLITACTTIAKPGTYDVKANLAGSLVYGGPPCIVVRNTNNVILNCQDHVITAFNAAIEVTGVNTYIVENCSLQQPTQDGGPIAELLTSSNGTFRGNTVAASGEAGWLNIANSTNLTVQANTFNSYLSEAQSTGTEINKNSFDCAIQPSEPYCGTLIALYDGSNNTVTNNTMNGETAVNAPYYSKGSDDIVNVGDETSDVIQGNTMENVWDCAIEITGPISSATISQNTITNAATCAVGGWFYLGLSNSTIANNTVSGAGDLFDFYRIGGLRPAGAAYPGSPADTGIYFTNNTFQGNTLTNPYAKPGDFNTYIPFDQNGTYLAYNGQVTGHDTVPTPAQFHLGNNRFSGNDFGTIGAVYLGQPILAGSVVDGGGNRCIPFTVPGYPLTCGQP